MNLWLQYRLQFPGAREKDEVKSCLNRQVCSGALVLSEALRQTASDWYAFYEQLHPAQILGVAISPARKLRECRFIANYLLECRYGAARAKSVARATGLSPPN